MIAMVLCGGQSTRMGTDKGLIMVQSMTWAQAAAEKMARLGLPVVLSVNEDQFQYYQAIFSADKLVKDDGSIGVKGPLGGLLTVHQQNPGEDLFVLACDMPLMDTGILTLLMELYEKKPSAAHVFMNDNAYEPLCGIYSAKALEFILQLQQTGRLSRYSMKYILEIIKAATYPLSEEQKKCFRNFNTPEELGYL